MSECVRIGDAELWLGDCREILPLIGQVDAIVTDPPYFKIKDDEWDRQWSSREDFLSWLDGLLGEFHRLINANGSLFMFAFPDLAAHIEVAIGRRFRVLNHIVWRKGKAGFDIQGWGQKTRKEDLRHFIPSTERIIFAEHYGSDSYAKGEAGYAAKCDELRGFLFEPLRSYLAGERDRAGWTTRKVAEAFQRKTGSRTVTRMAGHWFEKVQWELPTAENYAWLRRLFNAGGGKSLRREYDDLRREYDDLRREYENLRREYENLRRPFNLANGDRWSDVWDFDPVQGYPGKHPCEKPVALMEHIINSCSRAGDVIVDPFAGSATTGVACIRLGRKFVGMEQSEQHFATACRRIEEAYRQADLFIERAPKPEQQALL